MDLLPLVYEKPNKLFNNLMSLLVLVAIKEYLRVTLVVRQVHKVEVGLLSICIVHDAVDFVDFCLELYTQHFGLALVPGNDFGGLLLNIV